MMKWSLSRSPDQRITQNMRGRIAGHHPYAVTTIGNADRIEGIETFGYARPEQAPVLFSVPADVNIEDQLVAIFVVRCPAHGHGGAVADRGQRRRGRILGVAESVLGGGQIDGDLLRLAWLWRGLVRPRAWLDRNLIHHRGDVHRQIIDAHRIDPRPRVQGLLSTEQIAQRERRKSRCSG